MDLIFFYSSGFCLKMQCINDMKLWEKRKPILKRLGLQFIIVLLIMRKKPYLPCPNQGFRVLFSSAVSKFIEIGIKNSGCFSESIGKGRSYVNSSINIDECFFIRSTMYSGDGGVIYVFGSFSMNVSCSMFYFCFAKRGGAICFNSANSSLRIVCANGCSAGSTFSGHFALIGATHGNKVEHISVSNCSHDTQGYYSIWLQSGNQLIKNINSSSNNAYWGSGIGIITPSQFSSSYCTFSHNWVSDSTCMFFNLITGIISFVNVLNNNSPSMGVIQNSGGSPQMNYCIFDMNQNTLFYIYSGSLDISHSFIHHTGIISTGINNSFTKKQTYIIDFIGSKYCRGPKPTKEENNKEYMYIFWIVSLFVISLLFTLLVICFKNKMITSKILARHELEDSLMKDFG